MNKNVLFFLFLINLNVNPTFFISIPVPSYSLFVKSILIFSHFVVLFYSKKLSLISFMSLSITLCFNVNFTTVKFLFFWEQYYSCFSCSKVHSFLFNCGSCLRFLPYLCLLCSKFCCLLNIHLLFLFISWCSYPLPRCCNRCLHWICVFFLLFPFSFPFSFFFFFLLLLLLIFYLL